MKMDNIVEFKNELYEEFKRLPGFKENSSHYILMCPECEKHRISNKHGHFYINKVKDTYPGSCKKCSLSFSKLNVDILSKLNINNSFLMNYVRENFKTIRSHIINLDERNKKMDYSVLTDLSRFDKIKLNHLSDRLLYDIDNEEDIKTYRIVTNLSKFIHENNININKFDQKEKSQINLIDDHYIGFLSYYGNIINFRNMTGDNSLPRYLTFVVNREIRRSFFYTPSIDLNPLAENPKITVAEGPIDIICIHLNNKCYDDQNNIYAASSSMGSFRSLVKNCLYISGYYGGHIFVYLDNDDHVTKISDYDFGNISHALQDFGRDFKITSFINLSSKDFGDLREKMTIGKYDLNSLILQNKNQY